MAFTAVILVVAVVLTLVRGGRVGNLRDVRLGWVPLLLAGLALQVAVDLGADRGMLAPGAATGGLVASQLLVLAFVLRNRRHRGMLLLGVGFLLNAAVIVANGAMPVDPDAIRRLGVSEPGPITGKHELLTAQTRLPWLADRIPVPWLRMVLSVGDLVLGAGVLVLADGMLRRGSQRDGEDPAVPARDRRGGGNA